MEETRFGDIFQFIRNGKPVKQDKSGSGLPVTRIETIWNSTIDAERVGYAGIRNGDDNKWLLHKGDILFSHINSVDHIGKCAMYEGTPEKLIHGMNLLCLRTNREIAEPKFILHLLRSMKFRNKLLRFVNPSVNQASVSISNLNSIRVLLPVLDDQRRIAAVMDKADALREKRQQAINKLDILAQSVFLDMFGDPVKNPNGHPTKPIESFGGVITGNTPSRLVPDFFGSRIEWIKSDNINTPFHTLTKADEGLSDEGRRVARFVPAGSVLVTCIAGSPECIGNAAIADREVAFNQQINAVVPNDVTNSYFLYVQLLLAKRLVQRASTNGMKGMVSKSSFSKVRLIAPEKRLQDRFGLWFERLLGLYRKHVDSISRSDDLFYSLQQRAFSGDLFIDRAL